MRSLTLAALFLCAGQSQAQCLNGNCPMPVRSTIAAVAQAAPVRSTVYVGARVAVAPVRYVNERRPRLFQRFVQRIRCR